MKNLMIVLSIAVGCFLLSSSAHADLKQIKAYKETYPDAKPKCINCHMVEHPKKDDGEHDPNAYGKAVIAAAQAAKLDAPNADTYKAIGKIEDFKS